MHGRKQCVHGGQKGYKKWHYPPNFVACIRDIDIECSIGIMIMGNGNELYKRCILWCVSV